MNTGFYLFYARTCNLKGGVMVRKWLSVFIAIWLSVAAYSEDSQFATTWGRLSVTEKASTVVGFIEGFSLADALVYSNAEGQQPTQVAVMVSDMKTLLRKADLVALVNWTDLYFASPRSLNRRSLQWAMLDWYSNCPDRLTEYSTSEKK